MQMYAKMYLVAELAGELSSGQGFRAFLALILQVLLANPVEGFGKAFVMHR